MIAFDRGLLDPSTGSAGEASDDAFLRAMVDVEGAHLETLVSLGAASGTIHWSADDLDLAAIAAAGAAGGNPVIPLVAALRRATPDPLADAVHLGLTSQDVIDSALMLIAARTVHRAERQMSRVLNGLADLAALHRTTPVAGRTLGQQAAPTTVGLRLAVLLDGITRTWRSVRSAETPLQLGGSVGTLAVLTDRLGTAQTEALRTRVAARLGLDARPGVWHVERSPIAVLGAALAAHLGALGRLGLEVAQGTRPELGELALALGDGEGGSSAMPQKQNPVAAVLLVANARRAPGLATTLLGAQLAIDDRPVGDWHAEWQPLREMLRLVAESSTLAERAVGALTVQGSATAANIDRSGGVVHAERAQQVLAQTLGGTAAAAMVRSALETPPFVPAIVAAARADPAVDESTLERLRAVTATGGPIGLSDQLIDTIVVAARDEADR